MVSGVSKCHRPQNELQWQHRPRTSICPPRATPTMVSHICWMFCARSVLDLTCALTEVSISSIMSLLPEIMSSSSHILSVRLVSEVLVIAPKFFISRFPQFCFFFFFLILFPLSGLEMFYLFISTFCFVLIDFFKEFIHLLFKNLYHVHKSYLKVLLQL